MVLKAQKWMTLHISGVVEIRFPRVILQGSSSKGGLSKEQLGVIELQQSYAYVAVARSMAHRVVELTNNQRLKKKKVRITLVR